MAEIIELSGPEQAPASGKKASKLVILLHGLGANGDDLYGLVPHFAKAMPDVHFSCPNAPYPCDMAPYGLQWFSLMDRSEEKILEGVKNAAPILNQFIDSKKQELGLEDEDVALLGFSQGTMLSLYAAFRRERPLAGVLGYSGALVAPHLLKDEMKSAPDICLVHGEDDDIVPFEAFKDAMSVLQTMQLPVAGYSREGLGHGIDPAGLQIGIDFLQGLFGVGQGKVVNL